jgi:hypothetical protein
MSCSTQIHICNLSHSILQSLMQLSVHQFYISTTCFGHIGPSSGTISIVAKAVSCNLAFLYVHLQGTVIREETTPQEQHTQ